MAIASRPRLARARNRMKTDAAGGVTGDMPLVAHLAELRRRLFICVIAVVLCTVGAFFFWDRVLDVATDPYCRAQAARGVTEVVGGSSCQLYISNPVELFTTRLTVSGYIGLFISSPIILWQLWMFITPGLQRKERRYALPFVVSSVLLFSLGCITAWLTFPRAIAFFLAVGGDQIQTLFNPAPYLRLIFLMMLIFGAVFEFPLLLVSLQLAGVVGSQKLRAWRRQAIVANTVIAAVATPSQDPYSMAAMAIPLIIFYEVAIIIGRVLKK